MVDEDASPKSSLDDSHISRKKRMYHKTGAARNRFVGLSTEQKKRKFSDDIKSSDSEISNS